jgi:hypothetical protein
MTLQETPMRYVSCPTAVINAPVDVVWALLIKPAAWGGVFDVHVGSIDPPGPAIVGQKISGETGLRNLHLKPDVSDDRDRPAPTSTLPGCTFAVWHHCP